MDGDTFEKKYNTLGLDLIKTHQMFCQEVLKLLPGQMAVISNGRVRKKLSLSILFRSLSLLELQFETNYWIIIFISHLFKQLLENGINVRLAFLLCFIPNLFISSIPLKLLCVFVIPTAILELIWQNSQNRVVSDLLFVMFKNNFWSWSYLYFIM